MVTYISHINRGFLKNFIVFVVNLFCINSEGKFVLHDKIKINALVNVAVVYNTSSIHKYDLVFFKNWFKHLKHYFKRINSLSL